MVLEGWNYLLCWVAALKHLHTLLVSSTVSFVCYVSCINAIVVIGWVKKNWTGLPADSLCPVVWVENSKIWQIQLASVFLWFMVWANSFSIGFVFLCILSLIGFNRSHLGLRQLWFLTLQWSIQNFQSFFYQTTFSLWPKWNFPQFCYDINQRKNNSPFEFFKFCHFQL